MPEPYNQQTISLLDSQTNNLPSGIIPSDPKLTENVLGLVQNVPLPSVSELLTIEQKQELDKPEDSTNLIVTDLTSQPSKSYSSSLSETEKITSVDAKDDLLIGKVEHTELQGLLGGEPGDTVIGTAGIDSSVKLSPEDTLLNNAEVTSIKTEENQQQLGGELSPAENLQKSQAKEITSPMPAEETVESSQTKTAITPTTAAPEENSKKLQVETSIPITSAVEEEKKSTLQLEGTVEETPSLTPKTVEEASSLTPKTVEETSSLTPKTVEETSSLTPKTVEEASSLTTKTVEETSSLTPKTVEEASSLTTKTVEETSSLTTKKVEETSSLTTKENDTKTEPISNSARDEISKTKEELVTSSNQADVTKYPDKSTTQLNTQKSSEEVAKKEPAPETLTSSDPSKKGGSQDAISTNFANLKAEEIEAFKSGVFTVGASGEVGIDFLYDGGLYQGQLAIFSLEGMEKYKPGSPEFIKEAASRAASNSELGYIAIDDVAEGARFSGMPGETNYNRGEYQQVKSFKLIPGSNFGVMLTPNNRVSEVVANPMASGRARPLFSMATANPNEAFHVGQIADVTGEGNTFAMEDLRTDGWTDRDYNDIIFQVRGAIGKAALMDEVVASQKEWRTSNLGKALIAYAKAYINPDFEQEKVESNTKVGGSETELNNSVKDVNQSVDNTLKSNSGNYKEETGLTGEKETITKSPENTDVPSNKIDGDEKSLPSDETASIPKAIPEQTLPLELKTNSQTYPVTTTINTANNTESKSWEKSLIQFVDNAIKSEQPNAVVNLNITLTQVKPDGTVAPRYELTAEEKSALIYAQQNNILVVVPAGDKPGEISAIGQLSREFDNLITVGAAEKINASVAVSKAFELAPNSGSGKALDILAVGKGESSSSTAIAASNVTSAVSEVWAANPQLNYAQVIDIVKNTATDLNQPNWDAKTGAGMLNVEAAIWMAKATEPLPKTMVEQPISVTQIEPITLTPAEPKTEIDLSKVFAGSNLDYEVVNGKIDVKEKSVDTNFSVDNYYVEPQLIPDINKSLTNAIAIAPIPPITLTFVEPNRTIDLTQIFSSKLGGQLYYEILGENSDSLDVKIAENQLQLSALDKAGVNNVGIRVFDSYGNSSTTNFSVTANNLSPEMAVKPNLDLKQNLENLTTAIEQNPEDLLAGFETPEGEQALENLTGLLDENPNLLQFLTQPESLSELGVSDRSIGTLTKLLNNQELAAEFGLSVTLGEALSKPDSTLLDQFLMDADGAVDLLPSNVKQPKVGFIDFTKGQHIQRVTNTFSTVNPLANYDSFHVTNGNWAERLVEFVDRVKATGETHAIANLSLDLSQLDDIGITTRYELTPDEQKALQYARENNVLLVVASGNTGGVISALGQASKTFENIITVGAVNQFESKADYSGYGDELTLMAPGGTWNHNPNAFVGTSKATSYVTAAASLVWAANPELSLKQVKQLLIDSALDLNAPGWDETTGFGLINIKEAIRRSQLIEPDLSEVKPVAFTPSLFSGEGRVQTLARPTSEETEKAIAALQNLQQSLLEQWQTLADLGNPALTLTDLSADVKQKIATALEEYQQVSTDAGITTAQAQQWAEALALATQHYQIEKTRLQTLLQQQKELQDQLAALGQQKSALETETQKMLADIQKQIGVAESDLAKAQAKLTNPFADVDDNLQVNPQPWQKAANNEQQSASNFRQQANVQSATAQNYNSAANSINPSRWQVVGSASRPSGRTQEIWGWGNDPNLLKQKTQLQLQGQISNQNVQAFQQLAQQAEQQNAALNQYAQFLNQQQNLNLGNGNTNDANTVLQLLKQQLSDQETVANNYQKLAGLAEARRVQNQSSADWNNSQINRWQQVGIKRSGKKIEPAYGWVHYPEHIAPRDQAQQLANQAVQERNIYQQLASQSQQQVDALREQVRKLSERVKDWPVLQQGIEYEITADELRLQAEKDLLGLHTPVQQQKLETLNLQISQAQEELQKLENQKIPTQQQATDLTENRLKETQTEVEAIQTERAKAQKDLQNFLETAGFLLPYRERLTAVQKSIQQLEAEKLDVQLKMQQLANLITQTPSDSLRQQLNYWNDHLATINQELDWAKLQQDQLAQAIADSPERLALSALIKELETAPASINPTAKIEKLKLMEGSGANFLQGFDNLAQRLADAKAEETQTQKDLDKLNREYRELGLQKANFVDNLIPGKEKEIAAKDKQIAGTESAIAQTQASLSSLQNQLTQTQNSLAQKSAEVQQQEGVIAATQSQITNLQTQIAAKSSEMQQQQSVAQGYQNQINQANAAVNSLEQQRQQHQANANYWNSQVNTWGIVRWEDRGWWVDEGCGRGHWQSNWQPVYGSIYNPQAEANRNAEQAAANNAAWQRDVANQQAQQLSATLQPKIAVTQQQIATLQNQQQSLTQQQQALNNQLASQQSQLKQLQQELQGITQQVNNLQSQINQTQNQLNGLNTQLGNQQQQREDLIAQLAQLNQQKSDLEQKLIEKYREIELTDKYFDQVKAEVERLQSRLDLLNKAGVLEQKYQQNWQSWQQTTQAQAIATQAFLDVRKAGQPDRDRLAFLQQQLKDTQGNLDRAKSIQKSITDTQQSLEFTKLQLGNQNLLLQSLINNDDPLAALERYYLNDAAAHQQRIWYWNGSSYAYNAAEADAYRVSLQQGSFVADMRNRLWKQRQDTLAKINELNQKISQQTSDIAKQQSELASLGQTIPQIESQIITIQGEITTVNKRLEPLQVQENKQTQIIQATTTQAQNLAAELSQTTQLHSTALRQLIGFGILASESDVDFFATQVEPQVNTHLEQLKTVGNDLGNQINSQNQLIANWQQELANTQDDVSKQVLTNLIDKAKTQLGNLETLKASNQSNANELKELLKQATEALTPLRQKQELEIRQKLESIDGRIEALQSQLNSENAADAAIKSGTVLDHVQLADQINQDLRLGVTNWTEQLLAGNQQTKALVTQQQDLSKSVDELITYINDQLAEPDGNYNRIHADLEDGITTLGVVENRADELDSAFTSTEDAIERIKLRIEQDAKLWEEIAPIAIRYGVESQELKDYLKTPGDEKTRRAAFLAKYPDNGTAIDLLKGETLEGKNPNQQISNLLNSPSADVLLNAEAVEGRNPNQALFDKAKAEQASHEAQGNAALAQAAWYEQQAAYNWAVSRKNGPYWYEERWVKGRSGRGHSETITHVDYNWIIWQQYSQIFPQLRAQGYAHLVEADKWRKEKERIEPLKNQWVAANDAANTAEPPIDEARNFFAELEAARESIPGDQVQLASLENLLPIIQQQLEQAQQEADTQNAKVQQQWQEYDTDSEEYRAAIADILQRRGELNTKAIETQQQLADAERDVERQTVGLSTELESTKVLATTLQQQRQSLQNQITNLQNQGVIGEILDDFNTNLVQVDRSLQLLNNKAAILTAEQTALTQKRTMLTAQNEVILAEQRLLDAYIQDPDADYSNLQQQLNDARVALAEAQRLAEQAEAASQALTAPLQQLKTDLLAQNDEHLKAAKEHQQILKALVEATQSNANYTLQAAQKQQEVNNFEFQIIQRLQTATAAGNQEAKALLDVAQRNDMATAAEIYYRDYKDLASDRGGCAGGAGNAQDQMLANQYYSEMLNNRELQRRAQAQADAFRQAKETAEAQMKTLQMQQEIAAQLLNDLNAKVAETQAEREKKTQELAIAQASLDGITRIREQTEQTFIQLVTLEKLNLAQAQLEQEIAQNRQANIDEAVKERQERDRLELDRQRKETTAKIEQLKQLQAEDNLRQNLNQARGQLGLATLDPTDDPMQLQTQLAGLLTSLKDLETQQPDLPDDVKALLAEARGDIHLALQGKEATTIQDNLLKAMDGLIGQIEQYKTEINRIDLEEQWDNDLLQMAQGDLQKASQKFLEELQKSEQLSGEKQIIDPLYQEALIKIAYAEQAVEMSNDMAEQGKKMLDEIIKYRIEQRKIRKKMFWNKILGIISQVVGILSTVLMILSPAFPALIPLSIGLGAVSGAINTIQAVMNGDWMGAIFSGVMTGLTAISGGLGQMASEGAKAAAQTIKTLQTIASGAFSGARSLMSGDSIMGFLQILGSVATAASGGMKSFINQCSAPLQKVMLSVVQSLQQAPQMIYSGIKSIQSGDWLNAIGNFFNGAMAIGQSFAGNFNTAVAGILENVSKVGNTALYLGNAIKNGGIEGWLSGIDGILGIWKQDLMGMVDKISGKEECECPPQPECEVCEDESGSEFDITDEERIEEADEIISELQEMVYDKYSDQDISQEDLDKKIAEEVASILEGELLSPSTKGLILSRLGSTDEQIGVFSNLSQESRSQVFHHLPREDKEDWVRWYASNSSENGENQFEYSSGLPNSETIKENDQVVLSGGVTATTKMTPQDFVLGALLGEFNENPSFGQIVLDTVIGMIPGLGEIVDLRDIGYYSQKFYKDPSEMKIPWNWVGLFGSIIGLFPFLGGGAKGLLKIFRKVATEKAIRENFLDILQHIKFRDSAVPRKRGIGGAHDANVFFGISSEYKILSQTASTNVPGVERIEYQMRTLDKALQPTNQFNSKSYFKTIYDPQIWTDKKLEDALTESVLDAQKKGTFNREWNGVTKEGYTIRGYQDNGKVTSFFFD